MQHSLIDQENPAILFFGFGVSAVGFLGFLQQIIGAFQRVFDAAFIAVQQYEIELDLHTVRERGRGLLQVLPREVVLQLAPVDLA